MTNPEALVRSVLGPCRRGIAPFTCAIECVIERSFVVGTPMEDILITKDIYPRVAEMLHMRPTSAARQIERISNACWDIGDRSRLYEILGKNPLVCPTPKEMLFYFAAYSFYGIPYSQAIDRQLISIF